MSVLINSIATVTINVVNSDFFNNRATEFGGGAYVTFHTTTNHVITFRSCDFEENVSETHAGGMEIGFTENGNETVSNRVLVQDCVFGSNRAEYGGAVYVFFLIGI